MIIQLKIYGKSQRIIKLKVKILLHHKKENFIHKFVYALDNSLLHFFSTMLSRNNNNSGELITKFQFQFKWANSLVTC